MPDVWVKRCRRVIECTAGSVSSIVPASCFKTLQVENSGRNFSIGSSSFKTLRSSSSSAAHDVTSFVLEKPLNKCSGVNSISFSRSAQPVQYVSMVVRSFWIEIEIPFNAPIDRPCKMWQKSGDDLKLIELEISNQYTIQGDLFSLAILEDGPVPTPIEDAIANMSVIDAVFKSAESGTWIDI